MRITVLIIAFFASFSSIAQQDALYSQYMFNPFSINAAYAGSRSSYSTVLLHRSQWIGVEGAPMTQTLSMHTPAGEKGLAYGVNLLHDQIGPVRNFWGAFTGAYHLRMRNAKLSFAIRAGLFNTYLDRSKLTFENPTDQYNVNGTASSLIPSFDFGAYYYRDRFYAGLAINHLTRHDFNFSNYPADSDLFLRRHYMFMTGCVFKASPNVLLKPSVMLRYAEGSIPSADINLSVLLKQVWWIGVSCRNMNSLVFLTEYNIKDFLRIGYAFDLTLNQLRKYNSGSHEIFIGFDFMPGQNKITSPRYL